mmetsp:Transcript_13643/g.43604  ORF Transcript_13643/g.43604 Transcript_13643/m.43604 type:complete len:206 (+) Transcript_13643:268-885(+)
MCATKRLTATCSSARWSPTLQKWLLRLRQRALAGRVKGRPRWEAPCAASCSGRPSGWWGPAKPASTGASTAGAARTRPVRISSSKRRPHSAPTTLQTTKSFSASTAIARQPTPLSRSRARQPSRRSTWRLSYSIASSPARRRAAIRQELPAATGVLEARHPALRRTPPGPRTLACQRPMLPRSSLARSLDSALFRSLISSSWCLE